MTRRFTTLGCLLGGILGLLLSTPNGALAVTVDDLYETEQPVRTSQDAAFGEALRTVVVRVSGMRDAPERLGAALNNPRQYVQKFGLTSDGRLQVGFDDVSIDRLLSEAGLPVWGRERPEVLVLLSLPSPDGLGGTAADREAVSRAARDRGLPLKWAPADAIESAVANDPGELLAIAERNQANAVLVGRSAGAGAVQWTLISAEGEQTTVGSLEDGIHLAADTFARVFAASGSRIETVLVEVSGIDDLNAYATTMNYLEGMTLVRSVALDQIAGDTIRLRVAIRGDAATLQRAVGLDRRLVPAVSTATTGDASASRLAFRYQP